MRIIGDYAVFEVEDPEHYRAFLPNAKVAQHDGRWFVAVPDHLDYMQIMQNLGHEVTSPVRREYNWPIKPGWTPGWWQVDTTDFLTLNRRAFCTNGMRTRKTMSTLWAIDYLQKKGLCNRALVIGPLSALELAWADSIYFNFPRKSYAVLHASSSEKRRELLAKPKDIYIINHDGVRVILKDLVARKDIDLVVIDECHELKNSHLPKWKVPNKLINESGNFKWVWGLTGTPTPQAPTDAYGQAKLITPANITGSFTRFKNETMLKVNQFKWVERATSEYAVARIMKPAIRFSRSVVSDMEPCLRERHAELSDDQRHHYTEMKKKAVTEIRGEQVSAVNAAIVCQKLSQIACGVAYGTDGSFLHIDFGPRLKVLEELIEQNDEKVLVFVPFTGALEAIARELSKKWSVEVVNGNVTVPRRNKIFRDFQETPNPHVIVAHPGTMSYSLDLCAASLIIWYAPPAGGNKTYQQACARIDGGNQTVKIDIAHISGTKEERAAYEVVQGKGRYQDVILNLLKGG